jgi:hypothetical protein
MRRKGLECARLRYYKLNKAVFDEYRRAPISMVAELSGVNEHSLYDWCWHGKKAPERKARSVAEYLGAPFERLWQCTY